MAKCAKCNKCITGSWFFKHVCYICSMLTSKKGEKKFGTHGGTRNLCVYAHSSFPLCTVAPPIKPTGASHLSRWPASIMPCKAFQRAKSPAWNGTLYPSTSIKKMHIWRALRRPSIPKRCPRLMFDAAECGHIRTLCSSSLRLLQTCA